MGKENIKEKKEKRKKNINSFLDVNVSSFALPCSRVSFPNTYHRRCNKNMHLISLLLIHYDLFLTKLIWGL